MNAIRTSLNVSFGAGDYHLIIADSENRNFLLPDAHPVMVASWLEQLNGKAIMIREGILSLSNDDLRDFALANSDKWILNN